MIDIDVRENKELQQFMKEFPSQSMKVINEEQYKIVQDLRNDIIKSMRNTPRGSWNEKGIKNKFGYPSKPDFPPAIQSGNLINRIIPERGEGYSRLFTDNVKYAIYLEEGTVKMEARPFWEPAVERSNWEQKIRNRIIAERFAGRRLEE
jgi:HK97 gp10 family phage protein